jgi:hypothetical protein
MTTNFFSPLLLLFLDPGSEIRDPGSGMGKNQDPGKIPDPQHCFSQGQSGLQSCGTRTRTYGSGTVIKSQTLTQYKIVYLISFI